MWDHLLQLFPVSVKMKKIICLEITENNKKESNLFEIIQRYWFTIIMLFIYLFFWE